MKTVLFLGAGATRAQFEAEDEEKLKERLVKYLGPKARILPPPLDRDFFTWAVERSANNVPYVRAFFERELGVDLLAAHASGQVSVGMEWAFVYAFRKATAPNAYFLSRIALHHLLVIYRKLIAISTLPLFPPSAEDTTPLPKLLAELDEHSEDLSVVTTNQDLAVENLLDPDGSYVPLSRCRRKGKRTIEEFYGLSVDLPRRPLDPKGYREVFRSEGWPALLLLKLHGSLNWSYESDSDFDPVQLKPGCALSLLPEKAICWAEVLRASLEHPTRLYPFVVPPIEPKEGFLIEGVLPPVWERAREKLEQCKRLVVFGYGFPEADKEALDLFTTSLSPDVRKIAVIDKYPNAAKRLRDLRNESPAKDASKVQYFTSVGDYFANTPAPIDD